jgi:hypothetical protein
LTTADASPPIALEIFSKFRYASKNDFAVHDFANPPVTPQRHFGGRRSVGAARENPSTRHAAIPKPKSNRSLKNM